MKLARVRYVGTDRSTFVRGPSGEQYKLKNPRDAERWVDVSHLKDVEYFEAGDTYEVEWTPLGEIVHGVEAPMTGIDAMLADLGYRKKQEIAKTFGIKANKTEDELEEAIRPEVERLEEQMNHMR